MTSGRPYRPTMTSAAALAELRSCAGTQFDPIVVERFCLEVKRLAPAAEPVAGPDASPAA